MDGELGLYVHWPFCTAICPYCDFNVYRDRGVDEAQWRAGLVAEIDRWAARTGDRRLRSIYFGGGTPSLMAPDLVGLLIERACAVWSPADDLEVTLEANPTDAETQRFGALAAAGVNRLSLGVQSFDDAALRFLGRNHSGAEAARALETALGAFARVSFDLIYALPGQAADDWARALEDAARRGAGHMSLYQLTVEPGTAFEKATARGAWAPPDEDRAATLFETTQRVMAEAGLPAYEVSNHAREGERARHNMIYWRQGDYVGVGPGAHGRVTIDGARYATRSLARPADWLAAAGEIGAGPDEEAPLTAEQALEEKLFMGLRLKEGLTLNAGERRRLGARMGVFADLERDGLLDREGDRVALTPAGALVLNSIVRAIVVG